MSTTSTYKRGANFTSREVEKLIKLVLQHSKEVNNKACDSASNASKLNAWKAIEKEFNDDKSCNIYRSYYVLKTKYENLKKMLRKNHDSRRPSISANDESTYSVGDSEIDYLLKAELNAVERKSKNFEAFLNNPIADSIECIPSDDENQSPFEDDVNSFEFQDVNCRYLLEAMGGHEEEVETEEGVEYEWKTVTPQMLSKRAAEPQDSSITQSCDDPLAKRLKYSFEKSISWAELRKKMILEKHKLTLRLMKEEAEQRMKHESNLHALREEELQLQIQHRKEKHELELQLMKLNTNL